jgi:hypothetical protein
MKPKNMLTWMLWSAAAALSPPSHGQVVIHRNDAPGGTAAAPEVDPAAAASGLTLFLGGLALVRATWASRRRGD